MKHQTGDWLAKWYCGNILHFHAFSLNYASQNNSPTLFNRRSINTVGSGAGTNSGAPVRRKAPEKFLVVALHFLKCHFKWKGTPYCSEVHAFAVLCLKLVNYS